MGSMTFVDSAIERKLMDLHCAYIGKVVSTDGSTATVQPLGKIKEVGSTSGKTQAVVANVPIACKKFTSKTITYLISAEGATRSETVAVPSPLAAGDLVVCVCADRDITDARRGVNAVPPAGRHTISDSIIVGIL